MAHTCNQFTHFEETQEPWTIYKERLDEFFLANDINENPAPGDNNDAILNKKPAILLIVHGTETYTLVISLVAPAKPHVKTYEVNFTNDKSVAVYIAALRKMAASFDGIEACSIYAGGNISSKQGVRM